MEISELAKNISVILAALALISGIRAWKREFIGKRKIKLAEETLMLFYQAKDAIREIRNPFGRIDEGNTRKKADHETEEETKILNKAYVVFERYQKREEVFNKLQSIRYRFMAQFGRDTEKPFLELYGVRNNIFMAAHTLGMDYWQRQGMVDIESKVYKKQLDEMAKYEAIFWFKGEKRDEIGPRVEKIINQVENITRDALAEKDIWFKNIFKKG